MIKVLMICHGNICRSTMAESVFTHLVRQRGLEDCFEINSAATSREEIGNPPHYGTVTKLKRVGIPVVPHRARQMTKADYEYYDYLIGMDSANIRNMNRIAGGDPDGNVIPAVGYLHNAVGFRLADVHVAHILDSPKQIALGKGPPIFTPLI